MVPALLKEGITIYRELIAPPWRIMYKIENDTIYIMAIFDSPFLSISLLSIM